MAKLTSASRNKLPGDSFALPGRKYPIEDKSHAANARARASQFASPAEKETIFRKTSHFFPSTAVRQRKSQRG